MKLSLSEIRQHLHQFPELSEKEMLSHAFIKKEIESLRPDSHLIVEKNLVFIFDSGIAGPCIAFRAELDALPIEETSQLAYASKNKGISHVCGHDGHLSILVGLARRIAKNRPAKGKVVLIFQSAEETGQGALQLINNSDFLALGIDSIYALHNIPSFPLGAVIIRQGSFAAASRGMIVKLKGKTSHAAEPERGVNPALAIAEMIRQLHQLVQQKLLFSKLTLLTFIYINMGEMAFGTSAGQAEMGFTLRALENEDMQLLIKKSEELVHAIAVENRLEVQIEYKESFSATVCDADAFRRIQTAANSLNLAVIELDKPMKWSEDFAYYAPQIKTAFFGLGAGKDSPQLHHPDFDFPDTLIETGVDIFWEILKSYSLK